MQVVLAFPYYRRLSFSDDSIVGSLCKGIQCFLKRLAAGLQVLLRFQVVIVAVSVQLISTCTEQGRREHLRDGRKQIGGIMCHSRRREPQLTSGRLCFVVIQPSSDVSTDGVIE